MGCHHQSAGCRDGAQILTYMAFCEVSLDQFAGTAASGGDFGFKVSPHQSMGISASGAQAAKVFITQWVATSQSDEASPIGTYTLVPFRRAPAPRGETGAVDEMLSKVNWDLMDKRINTTSLKR